MIYLMDEIAEVKHRLDIVEVISGYLTLKRAGANMKGLCPFHQEKTPSFMVSPERQSFKCFGCGEGGDIFTFIEKIEGLDFYNALKLLADRAGVKLEQRSFRRGQVEYKADRKTRLFEINNWAKRLYHKILVDHPKGEKARSYLMKRGLAQETINLFEIGYAPDSWDFLIRFLKKKSYSEEEMAQAGLVVRNDRGSYYDRFRGRITFPINSIMGQTIAFTARTLNDDAKEAKYINSADSLIYVKGEVLYGLDKAKAAIRQEETVVVVEGNMDVISCHQAGFLNVVASSGTALTEQQLKILCRYAAEIIFCFDGDTAGIAAMKRAVAMALKNDISAKILSLPPPFKDPDEAIAADPKNWQRAARAAKPAMEHWIDLLIKENPSLPILQKKKIAKEILPIIALTDSSIECEFYLRYLAFKLAVSERSLIEALAKTKSGEKNDQIEKLELKKGLSLVERILVLIWLEPNLLEADTEIRGLDLETAELKSFSKMVSAGKIRKKDLAPEEISLLEQSVLVLCADLETGDKAALKSEFAYLLGRLKQEKKDRLKERFARKIRTAESEGDQAKIKSLLLEYSSLLK